MKIAIIGSGISGLTSAYLLNQKHDITLFEKEDRVGGHTATKTFTLDGKDYAIDTGFIVYNDWTYPNFIKLLSQLKVPSQPTKMGFSVSCEKTGLEYSGGSLNTLFAQKWRFFSPVYWRFIYDIVRFNRQAKRDLERNNINASMTLGDYLVKNEYSVYFTEKYLVPMGSAIWSMSCDKMLRFPLEFFIRFFKNHGLLNVKHRPTWRTISGGSHSYIPPLTASFKDKIQLNSLITSVDRHPDGVDISFKEGKVQRFDHVVFACHSDQALALIKNPTFAEKNILSAISYEDNDVILHTDTTVLPKDKKTWSSWNYRLKGDPQQLPTLSYNMNILQNIQSDHTFCVTLNDTNNIDPDRIIGRYRYAHPQFTLKGEEAKSNWKSINNTLHTSFCGAYWANGFHEDGVTSAMRVASALGVDFV